MKKVYLMAAALMFTGAVFTAGVDAQQRDGSPERDSARDAEAKRSAVHKATIDGMMWGRGCVSAVRETISGLEGVEKVEVSFEAKQATITMKSGSTLERASLEKAFEGTRFSVSAFSTEGEKEAEKEDGEKEEAEKEENKGDAPVFKAGIGGMGWPVGWPRQAREALERLEGVEKVQVSYADKSATITMKAGKTLDREAVAKALEATTFTVTSFEVVKPDAEDSEDSEDSEG